MKSDDLITQTSDTEFINMYNLLISFINPGINKLLSEYESNNKINHFKEKFQKMFGEEDMREKYFLNRPIDKEFIQYAAMDVLYLQSTMINMKKTLSSLIKSFYNELNIEILTRLISFDYNKLNCTY